jgi:hypothetical protein
VNNRVGRQSGQPAQYARNHFYLTSVTSSCRSDIVRVLAIPVFDPAFARATFRIARAACTTISASQLLFVPIHEAPLVPFKLLAGFLSL